MNIAKFEEQVFYRTFPMVVSKTNKKPKDDNKLITNYNLRYEQQQRIATICRYKRIRQQKKKRIVTLYVTFNCYYSLLKLARAT